MVAAKHARRAPDPRRESQVSVTQLPVRPRQKWICALGNTADGVFILDAAQRIIFWNRPAERILGYSQAEVLHRHCYEVIVGRCYDKLWCHANCKVVKSVRKDTLLDAFDILTHTRENKDIWINVSTVALSDSRKHLIVHSFRDVTYQKRNEETIRRILSSFDVRWFPKGNPGGDPSPLQSLLCQENRLSTLTRREFEILQLLADGVLTKEIAQRIGGSPFTVRHHIQNTLRKLGLHSRSQAISYFFRKSSL